MTALVARPRPGFALGTDYTRWLQLWLKCDEAPGALTLLDSSGNGNDVSPNFAPVWTPGFTVGSATASYLKCMRPATPFDSGILLEPTAVGGSGVGITAAAEPVGGWNLTPIGATTVDNTGTNSITWTTRAAAITFANYGSPLKQYVHCGLGGSVCVPRSSRGMFESVMGWNKTDTWQYIANTITAVSGGIHDSISGGAGAIPTGLAANDVVLATGFATVDDQMFGVVQGTPTPSDIVIAGGMVSADTNAGALPITLRRVHYPQVVVIAAWYTPLTASATTNPGYLLRAATNFGSGSLGAIHARAREDGTRRVMIEINSPGGVLSSVTRTSNGTVGTPAHVTWVFDRVSQTDSLYIDGVFNTSIALSKNSRCVLRDVADATWNARRFLMQFFAGNAIAAYRDVQLYAGPALPRFGLSGSFIDLVKKIKDGNGPLTQSDWP